MTKLAVGDTVIVHSHRQAPREATVTKIGRAWITVARRWQEQRFRLDDQTDGSGYSHGSRFYTHAQWAEKQQLDAAMTFLRAQGIDVRYDSPWRGRETELATIIRSIHPDYLKEGN